MKSILIFILALFCFNCTNPEDPDFAQTMEKIYRKTSKTQYKFYKSYLEYQQSPEELKQLNHEAKIKGNRFILLEFDLFDEDTDGWVYKKQLFELPPVKGPGNCTELYTINYGLGNCLSLHGASLLLDLLLMEGWAIEEHKPSWREVGQGLNSGLGIYTLKRPVLCSETLKDLKM